MVPPPLLLGELTQPSGIAGGGCGGLVIGCGSCGGLALRITAPAPPTAAAVPNAWSAVIPPPIAQPPGPPKHSPSAACAYCDPASHTHTRLVRRGMAVPVGPPAPLAAMARLASSSLTNITRGKSIRGLCGRRPIAYHCFMRSKVPPSRLARPGSFPASRQIRRVLK